MSNKFAALLICFSLMCFGGAYAIHRLFLSHNNKTDIIVYLPEPSPSVSTISPSPSPLPVTSPTLSPEDRQTKYGPCASFPVLMYHHVSPIDEAKAGNFTSLNVSPDMFDQHLTYIEKAGYTAITPHDVSSFFAGTPLPAKPILITFDDGYTDNATYAYPLLKQHGMKATIYLATGLLENPQYMNWSQVRELSSSSLINFGNHTWSHHSAHGNTDTITREIMTADTQLSDHAVNTVKSFAYPYGSSSATSIKVLSDNGYTMAFTTTHGTWQCKGLRYTLPRIRIGNSALRNYGI